MIEPLLKSELEPVARRHRRLQLVRGLTLCWGAAALVGFAFFLVLRVTHWQVPFALPILAAGAGVAAFVTWKRSQKWEPDFRQIARQIEQHHPGLHSLLLTAVEQQPDAQTGKLNFLQERVIREAIAESRKHQWINAVSDRRLFWMQCGQLAALALLITVLAALRTPAAPAAKASFAEDKGVKVTPGDTSLERGSGLVVLARFAGALPAEATLVIGATPENSRRVPLAKNLNDPVFGGSIPELSTNVSYHIEYGGERTRDFKVTVFEHPRLERSDADITFPTYTGVDRKHIDQTRRVSAVEGSRLDLSLQLNKPVASARLVAKDKSVVPLVVETNKSMVSLKQFPLEASKSYELQLVDADGRTNKVPAQFVIDVLKNRAPELKIAAPRGDQRVSPLQEVSFQAEVWDDFGLGSYGLTYTLAGHEPKTITLDEKTAPNEKRQLNHLLSLEELSAQPDQLISWFIWAEDIGPDGQVRRTSSDMFFAEVRPFDEIYREGQSQESQGESQQQQQQKGNESTKLAELQKQVINATWKLQRQEAGRAPSAQYQKDAPVVQEAQAKALEQAQELKEATPNPRSKVLLETVEQEMEKALEQLTKATNSSKPLPSALASEQAAYQALLKLAAREYQVSKSRSQSSSKSGEQSNQRQLDQLDLKQTENRYETQRQASPQQSEEQREQLGVLNRLKELAQRQQDLNDRIKELQNALQEAKTDEEREEVRRRLKRLREEEQEMLADVDELRQRMEQPQNQSRMADARQQLDKTRSEVQKASEALDKESPSQALASGTRAQRDLQQMRDDFRKKNSSQFSDEMRQMRGEARQLAQNQEDIGKKLDSMKDSKRKSLSDSGEGKELAEEFAKQKNSLTNLLDNMRNVSEKSETSEPLLAKQLYDTLRKTSQGNAENALSMSEELLKQSFVKEAGQTEQRARQEIEDLKRGVERAAESVLGNEADALRLAKRELDELTRQLEGEVSRADAKSAQGQPSSAAGQPTPGGQSNTNGTNLASGANNGRGNTNQSASAQSGNEKGQPNQADNQKAPAPQPSPNGQEAGQQASTQSGKEAGNSEKPANQQSKSGTQPGQSGQNSQSQNGKSNPQNSEGKNPQPNGSPSDQANGQQSQPGQDSPGQGSAPGQSSQQPNGQQASNPKQNSSQPNRGNSAAGRGSPNSNRDSLANFFNQGSSVEGGGTSAQGPLTGEEFTEWSERLGNVEEMLDMPELRTEVARIRDSARAMRAEFKRHSKEPKWQMVKTQIVAPLAELRSRIAEELARRESNDALVPIDRDPVPTKFSELVRRYYEKLGSSE